MSAVPAKIVLKSTTKVTLSDRFTQIQKIRPPPTSPQEVRVQMAENQQSSQQNRRLAQQMANRPAVQAALGIPPRQQPKQQQSLMQRLGPTNVKARLSFDNNVVGRGRRGAQQRGGFRGVHSLQNGSFRGENRGYVTVRGRGYGGRGRGGFSPRWFDDGRPRGRGGFGRPGGGRQYFRGGGRGATIGGRGDGIVRVFGRGQWGGFRGRGRRGGQRGRGGANQPEVSKEQLDNQLEEYMAKTKSHLDQELDQYMADANP